MKPYPHDFSLCTIQYLIDHPDQNSVQAGKATGISSTSAQQLKRELGLPVRTKQHTAAKPTKELIATRCGWDVPKTAAELERYGYKITLRQVQRLCGERPWTKKQVERYLEGLKRRLAHG